MIELKRKLNLPKEKINKKSEDRERKNNTRMDLDWIVKFKLLQNYKGKEDQIEEEKSAIN